MLDFVGEDSFFRCLFKLHIISEIAFFFKYRLFENGKELSKSNQNWCASPTTYVDLKSENHLAVACLEKIQNFVR